MNEDEIDVVAEELAKIGGLSWYPGRPDGAFLRAVSDRYREQAQAVINAIDKLKARRAHQATDQEPDPTVPSTGKVLSSLPDEVLQIGMVVEYRPPGDRRAILCRIEKLEEGRAFLVPFSTAETCWVALDTLMPSSAGSPTEEV